MEVQKDLELHQFIFGKFDNISGPYQTIAATEGLPPSYIRFIYKLFDGVRPTAANIPTFKDAIAIKLTRNRQLVLATLQRSSNVEPGRNYFLLEHYQIASLEHYSYLTIVSSFIRNKVIGVISGPGIKRLQASIPAYPWENVTTQEEVYSWLVRNNRIFSEFLLNWVEMKVGQSQPAKPLIIPFTDSAPISTSLLNISLFLKALRLNREGGVPSVSIGFHPPRSRKIDIAFHRKQGSPNLADGPTLRQRLDRILTQNKQLSNLDLLTLIRADSLVNSLSNSDLEQLVPLPENENIEDSPTDSLPLKLAGFDWKSGVIPWKSEVIPIAILARCYNSLPPETIAMLWKKSTISQETISLVSGKLIVSQFILLSSTDPRKIHVTLVLSANLHLEGRGNEPWKTIIAEGAENPKIIDSCLVAIQDISRTSLPEGVQLITYLTQKNIWNSFDELVRAILTISNGFIQPSLFKKGGAPLFLRLFSLLSNRANVEVLENRFSVALDTPTATFLKAVKGSNDTFLDQKHFFNLLDKLQANRDRTSPEITEIYRVSLLSCNSTIYKAVCKHYITRRKSKIVHSQLDRGLKFLENTYPISKGNGSLTYDQPDQLSAIASAYYVFGGPSCFKQAIAFHLESIIRDKYHIPDYIAAISEIDIPSSLVLPTFWRNPSIILDSTKKRLEGQFEVWLACHRIIASESDYWRGCSIGLEALRSEQLEYIDLLKLLLLSIATRLSDISKAEFKKHFIHCFGQDSWRDLFRSMCKNLASNGQITSLRYWSPAGRFRKDWDIDRGQTLLAEGISEIIFSGSGQWRKLFTSRCQQLKSREEFFDVPFNRVIFKRSRSNMNGFFDIPWS